MFTGQKDRDFLTPRQFISLYVTANDAAAAAAIARAQITQIFTSQLPVLRATISYTSMCMHLALLQYDTVWHRHHNVDSLSSSFSMLIFK